MTGQEKGDLLIQVTAKQRWPHDQVWLYMYPGFPLNFVNLPIFAEYAITHFDQNIILSLLWNDRTNNW